MGAVGGGQAGGRPRTLWVGLDVFVECRAGGHHTVVVNPLEDQEEDLVDPRRLASPTTKTGHSQEE